MRQGVRNGCRHSLSGIHVVHAAYPALPRANYSNIARIPAGGGDHQPIRNRYSACPHTQNRTSRITRVDSRKPTSSIFLRRRKTIFRLTFYGTLAINPAQNIPSPFHVIKSAPGERWHGRPAMILSRSMGAGRHSSNPARTDSHGKSIGQQHPGPARADRIRIHGISERRLPTSRPPPKTPKSRFKGRRQALKGGRAWQCALVAQRRPRRSRQAAISRCHGAHLPAEQVRSRHGDRGLFVHGDARSQARVHVTYGAVPQGRKVFGVGFTRLVAVRRPPRGQLQQCIRPGAAWT